MLLSPYLRLGLLLSGPERDEAVAVVRYKRANNGPRQDRKLRKWREHCEHENRKNSIACALRDAVTAMYRIASSDWYRPLRSNVSARFSRQVTKVATARDRMRASSGYGQNAMVPVKTTISVVKPIAPAPRKRSGRGSKAANR